jgi:hypothetical protein
MQYQWNTDLLSLCFCCLGRTSDIGDLQNLLRYVVMCEAGLRSLACKLVKLVYSIYLFHTYEVYLRRLSPRFIFSDIQLNMKQYGL